MGLHSSILRERYIKHENRIEFNKAIKEFDNGVPFEVPTHIIEEFYIGKNITSLQTWMVELRKRQIIENGHSAEYIRYVDGSGADQLRLEIEEIGELNKVVNKVLRHPELGKELFPGDEYEDYLDDDTYYRSRLRYISKVTRQLLDEHQKLLETGNTFVEYYYDAG